MDRQREVVPKRWGTGVKSTSTSNGLDPRTPGTDKLVSLFDHSEWEGIDAASMERR